MTIEHNGCVNSQRIKPVVNPVGPSKKKGRKKREREKKG